MLKAIFGLLNVNQGEILLNGDPIQNQPPNSWYDAAWASCPRNTTSSRA